jgi:iron(III) transport system ATP-binding protein
LLDEPLSNLDTKLRLELRREIRRVCQEYQLTTVYVTHDQKEALSIADRLAILEHGRILQIGTPQEIYRRPISRTVAHFMGETNFLPAQVLAVVGLRLTLATAMGNFEGLWSDPTQAPVVGASVTISIRPEGWELRALAASHNCVAGRIGDSVYLGEIAQHEFITDGGLTLKISERNPRFTDGTNRPKLYATVDPADVVVLVD